MSFILEALRKLEEKRVPATTREILVGRSGGMLSRTRRAPRSALAAGLLLAGGGFLAAWLILGGGIESKDAGSPPGASPNPLPRPPGETVVRERALPAADAVPPAAPVPLPSPPPPASATREGPAAAERTVERDRGAAAPPGDGEVEAALLTPEPAAAPEEGPAAPAGLEVPLVGDAAAGKLYRIEELPDEVRKDLDGLRIAGHVYSEESSLRLLSVGEGLRREGETLGPGVMLEEITPEGAVFTYRGYRFFVRGY